MRCFCGFLAACLFLAASVIGVPDATAQSLTTAQQQQDILPKIRNPGGIIADYSVASVGQMLSEMGLPWTTEYLDVKTQVVVANVYGLNVLFVPGECGDGSTSCTDLQMMSLFEGNSLSPVTVGRFNNDFVFGYVGLDSSGFFIRRYDFEETGLTRAHLHQGILSFRVFAELFFQAFRLNISEAPRSGSDPAEPPLSLRPNGDAGAPIAGRAKLPFETSGLETQQNKFNIMLEKARQLDGTVNHVQ